jgi:S-adenosylmethionine:tRNA ribosyltransferase-isomerase
MNTTDTNKKNISLNDTDYYLPQELIAEKPVATRGTSRLMAISRNNSTIQNDIFTSLPSYFSKGDTIIFNNTRVLKARLLCKTPSGRDSEILLIKRIDECHWKAMVKFSRKFKIGTKIKFQDFIATIGERIDEMRIIEFDKAISYDDINRIGITPIPPYIAKKREDMHSEVYRDEDDIWYQTVFAKYYGSVAAPTASLHFTEDIINNLKKLGVNIGYITLHIGPGTFKPIDTSIEDFKIHYEWIDVPNKTIELIKRTKNDGKKIIGVGTTVTRALETAAKDIQNINDLQAYTGDTNLFIKPGFDFKIIDILITNFHLPKSTLLLLVYAFGGIEFLQEAYRKAIEDKYRFYSYGDVMIIS